MSAALNIPKFHLPDFKSMPQKDRRKFIILIVVLVAMIVLTIVLMPYISQLLDESTRAEFVAKIRSKGPWGVIILLALQVLQVVVAFIPGEVVQIMAGVLYGAFGGWAICTLGTAISSLIVFKLVNRLGMPFVEDMISPAMAKKLDFLKDSKRLDIILFILFFIPGIPKDVLTYFAPLTKISVKRFILLTMVARTPALIASTYGGSAWTQGNYGSMAIVFIVCGAIGILGILFRDRILGFFAHEKEKHQQRLIDEGRMPRTRRRLGLGGPTPSGSHAHGASASRAHGTSGNVDASHAHGGSADARPPSHAHGASAAHARRATDSDADKPTASPAGPAIPLGPVSTSPVAPAAASVSGSASGSGSASTSAPASAPASATASAPDATAQDPAAPEHDGPSLEGGDA